MPLDQLLLFIAAGVLLNLTPGPDVLYIVSNALRSGARVGMVAALGITAGCFVHIFAAAVGVSALMAASATAFTVLKWAGAAYLVYVGVRLLLAKANSAMQLGAACADSTGAGGNIDYKTIFLRGFWTNALNPKVALFFLAFVPQFIAPDAPHKALAFIALGAIFNVNGMLWCHFLALSTALASRRLRLGGALAQWLNRAIGALFLSFGLKLALSSER